MLLSERLQAARGLIGTPEQWVKRTVARDAKGEDVAFDAATAVAFDSLGAVLRTGGVGAFDMLRVALPAGYTSVSKFNDNRQTTHADVMDLFDWGIALAEEREAHDCC